MLRARTRSVASLETTHRETPRSARGATRVCGTAHERACAGETVRSRQRLLGGLSPMARQRTEGRVAWDEDSLRAAGKTGWAGRRSATRTDPVSLASTAGRGRLRPSGAADHRATVSMVAARCVRLKASGVRALLAVSVWAAFWLGAPGAAQARTLSVTSGPLTAVVRLDPWQLRFAQGGRSVLSELTDTLAAPDGSLGFGANPVPTWGGSTVTPDGSAWWHATRAVRATVEGSSVMARVATNDPRGRQLLVTVAPAGSGVISVHATTLAPGFGSGAAGVTQMAEGFSSVAGEHFSGFGGRVNAVNQAGGTVETWSGEAPGSPAIGRSPPRSSSRGRSRRARTVRTSQCRGWCRVVAMGFCSTTRS
jgi:hypothetical protein